jgi:DNA polymerase-3 subunit epsilon
MREIVLDTETTGLNPFDGHRIVEIGAVELWHQVPTGRTYHQYINPERDMPEEAFNVHGISEAFLADKPVFRAIAQAFIDFVEDSKLVIHNASFDMRFLNAELEWAGLRSDPQRTGDRHAGNRAAPVSRVARIAGCAVPAVRHRQFTMREKHGALLDSEILADVYLELIGGKQPDFALEQGTRASGPATDQTWRPAPRPRRFPRG